MITHKLLEWKQIKLFHNINVALLEYAWHRKHKVMLGTIVLKTFQLIFTVLSLKSQKYLA